MPCLQFARFQGDEVKKIENPKQLVWSVRESFFLYRAVFSQGGKGVDHNSLKLM